MISVIIPAFNAAAHLPGVLGALVPGVTQGLIKQAIVADGGSTDETGAIAEAAGCEIVTTEKGRARQLIAGAAAARADWLLFLHADTVLAPAWVAEVERFMAAPQAEARAATFRFAFDDASAPARRVAFWARLRGHALKLPYGDQGLLISRAFYDLVGGYRPLDLMEDVDLVRRIGARRLTLFQTEAVTSADKYRRDGFERRAWRNLGLLARYFMGADPSALAKAYD